MNSAEDSFLKLSEILTGFDSLDSRQAGRLWARMENSIHAVAARNLVSAFANVLGKSEPDQIVDSVLAVIESDASLRAAAEQIIYLWYLSAELDGADWKFGSEVEYSGSLLWRAIGAHPPGLSGGYMGQWRYLPGNLE